MSSTRFLAAVALFARLVLAADPSFQATQSHRITVAGCTAANDGIASTVGTQRFTLPGGAVHTGCFCEGHGPANAEPFVACPTADLSFDMQAGCLSNIVFAQDGSWAATAAQCTAVGKGEDSNTFAVVATPADCPAGESVFAVDDTGDGGCQCASAARTTVDERCDVTQYCTQQGRLDITMNIDRTLVDRESRGSCSAGCRAGTTAHTLASGGTICCPEGAAASADGICQPVAQPTAPKRRHVRRLRS